MDTDVGERDGPDCKDNCSRSANAVDRLVAQGAEGEEGEGLDLAFLYCDG